jgi:hypothetical protein
MRAGGRFTASTGTLAAASDSGSALGAPVHASTAAYAANPTMDIVIARPSLPSMKL